MKKSILICLIIFNTMCAHENVMHRFFLHTVQVRFQMSQLHTAFMKVLETHMGIRHPLLALLSLASVYAIDSIQTSDSIRLGLKMYSVATYIQYEEHDLLFKKIEARLYSQ